MAAAGWGCHGLRLGSILRGRESSLFVRGSSLQARRGFTLRIVKEVLMEVEQVLGRGGEKDAGNVFCSSIILHAQQVGGPAQVGLLVHFGMAAKDDVEAASARAALQHEQAQFVLLLNGRSGDQIHLVGAQMVDVHTDRLAQPLRSFEATVLRGQAGVVELYQLPLCCRDVGLGLRMANRFHPALLRLAVAIATVCLLGRHGLHHLVALLIIYQVYTHDSFLLSFTSSVDIRAGRRWRPAPRP